MRRACVGGFVVVVLTMVGAAARAEVPGTAIDLTTFGKAPQEPAAVWDGLPIQPVARWDGESPRRFYLSGMIGPSFATFGSPGNPMVEPNQFAASELMFALRFYEPFRGLRR